MSLLHPSDLIYAMIKRCMISPVSNLQVLKTINNK